MNLPHWTVAFQESLVKTLGLLVTYLPNILGAILLVGVGVLVATLIRGAVGRLFRLLGVDRIQSRSAAQAFLHRFGVRRPLSGILATLTFWVIIFVFLVSGAEVLGLEVLSRTLEGMAFYVPKIGAAGLILVLGVLAASVARDVLIAAFETSGISQGKAVGQAVYVGAVLVVIVTSASQLGIDTTLLNYTITILVGGFVVGGAVSFGLGAREAMGNLIAVYYARPLVKVGQRVRLGELSGEVRRFTHTAVLIDTKDGRVAVPGKRFSEEAVWISKES